MIGLINVDNKLPNLALMKISSYYKSLGEQVEFVKKGSKYSKIFAAATFSKSKPLCDDLKQEYGDLIEIGGTGYDIKKTLPLEIECRQPDYDLWTMEMLLPYIRGAMSKQRREEKARTILNAGMGFTSRGCVNKCRFCCVPEKEGEFRQAYEIKDLINPRSNVLILHDNNLTCDPYCLDKLAEIKERKLVVDINQGVDIRLMTDEIAFALSKVKHLRRLHYAWDLMEASQKVLAGYNTLIKYIRPYRHMCYVLVGFNTSFDEDNERVSKLLELGVDPYIMVYNDNEANDRRLKHYKRYINGRVYKQCKFEEYSYWLKELVKTQSAAA